MNNFFYPFQPQQNNFFNIFEEFYLLKERVKHLEEQVKKLENDEENKYLKDDDNYYMI